MYENLDWLEENVSFPILRVSNDRSLRDDVINGVNAQGQPWLTIPAYLADESGGASGINWRQCTKNYKLDPIYRKVTELLGLRPRQQLSPETSIEMWLGVSLDEVTRMRSSRSWWVRHRYPLVDDLPMTRSDCGEWFAERYPDRELTRSACIGCPFRSAQSWLALKEQEPEQFQQAVEIDASLRQDGHHAKRLFRKRAYLHQRRLPLDEAVKVDAAAVDIDGFLNECEGHCGL